MDSEGKSERKEESVEEGNRERSKKMKEDVGVRSRNR